MIDLQSILEDEQDLISILPLYQRKTIESLLKQGKSNNEIAEIWLEANGPSNTFPFGTDNKKNIFFEKLKLEVEDFICNEDKYVEEREKFIEYYKSGQLLAVSFLTNIIALRIGATPSLITPVIVLILHTAFKLGVNTWCSVRLEEKDISESPKNNK